MKQKTKKKSGNVGLKIIESIFKQNYKSGSTRFDFSRESIVAAAKRHKLDIPKNLGGVIYDYRYGDKKPEAIRKTEPSGFEWIIVGAGRAKYRFELAKINAILPRKELIAIKIPDATPSIIGCYDMGDEQSLLARIRYNRLVDTFLGITAYSLQNHLRTSVKDVGQIEIDEVYVGVDKQGRQYVIPVQAKSDSYHHGAVQTLQDMNWAKENLPNLICRPVSVQMMDANTIVMFELTCEGDDVKVIDEKHYVLVDSPVESDDLERYRRMH